MTTEGFKWENDDDDENENDESKHLCKSINISRHCYEGFTHIKSNLYWRDIMWAKCLYNTMHTEGAL